jgi:hypothetical protein
VMNDILHLDRLEELHLDVYLNTLDAKSKLCLVRSILKLISDLQTP